MAREFISYDSTDEIADDLAKLLREKGINYGPSFKVVAQCMRNLFPNGIPVNCYGDAGLMTRCLDKFCRMAFSPREGDDVWANCTDQENPWRDVAGYGILGVESHEEQNE